MNMPEIEEGKQIRIDLSLSGMVVLKSKTIPHIKIYKDHVPTETKSLYLVLEDISLLNSPHGIKLMSYDDTDIVLNNSFELLIPLSPPPRSTHKYQLTVRALNVENQVISYGKVIKLFP